MNNFKTRHVSIYSNRSFIFYQINGYNIVFACTKNNFLYFFPKSMHLINNCTDFIRHGKVATTTILFSMVSSFRKYILFGFQWFLTNICTHNIITCVQQIQKINMNKLYYLTIFVGIWWFVFYVYCINKCNDPNMGLKTELFVLCDPIYEVEIKRQWYDTLRK